MLAVKEWHTAVVELLLKHDADTGVKSNDGWTALTWATKGGGICIVELLLNKGVDVNAKNNDGKTAADIAVEASGGHAYSVKLLLTK